MRYFRSIRDVEICVSPYVRETSDDSVVSSRLLPLQKKRVQADREASPPGLTRGHPCRECWLSRQDKAAGPTNSSRSVPPTRGFPASLWHMFFRSDAGKGVRNIGSSFRQDPQAVSALSRSLTRSTSRAGPRRLSVLSPSLLVGLRCHLLESPR